MILKNILHRKVRSLLTVVGIGLGVMVVVALGGIGDGLVAGYSGVVTGSGNDLMLIQADAYDITTSNFGEEIAAQVATVPGVRAVARMLVNFVSTEGLPYVVVFGYDPNEYAMEHFKIIEGHTLSAGGGRRGKEILLGKSSAEHLDKQVGDTIRLFESTYRVVGIYETGVGLEDGGAVMTLDEAQKLFQKPRKVSGIGVKVKHIEELEVVQERIRRRFSDVSVSAAGDFASQQQALTLVKGMAWAISFLAVIIGGVGMMNTVLMSVLERTREIGVLRALGWRRGRVLRMILGESLLLSAVGGLFGFALGYGVLILLAEAPATGSLIQATFSPDLVVQTLLVIGGLGVMAGAYPAWRASQLTPLEALRYEGGQGDGFRLPFGGMILRSLFRRRTRTVLTLLGVGLGIATIVALGGITEGFITQFTDAFSKGGTDLVAREADVADTSLSTIDERIGQRIAAMPQVANVSGMIFGVVSSQELPMFIVTGYHPNEYAIQTLSIIEGQSLRGSRELLISRSSADSLKKGVGDRLRLMDTMFRIVGIYEGGGPFEAGGGVISLRDAQTIFGRPRQVSMYMIKLRDPAQADAAIAEISQRFPKVSVSRSAEFVEKMPDMESMNAMMGAIYFLAILVGGVSMMNTVLMSVFERTREIGTLRALGWRRRRVLWMILREAVLLSLFSGAAGVLLGMGLAWLAGQAPMVGGFIQPAYSVELFVQVGVVAIVLGVIAGLYPAWWASNLNPLEALRYE
ncbi:MAG: ABC transporter permease [Chloroflexi bacterium]|nr:ABC transporter permease [Chloroflexota bacterium]